MEGGGENSPYGGLENNPNSWLEPSSPLTATDGFLWAKDNLSHQQLLNTVTNHPPPPFQPKGFFRFLTGGGATGNHKGGVSELTTPQDQTRFIKGLILLDGVAVDRNQDENLNSNSCVVQSTLHDSLDGAELTEKGSSSAYWVKGQWTTEEDRKLVKLVKQYGHRKWAAIAEHMVGRIGKQCRERWHNHLRPDIKKALVWTDEEERLIIEAHERVGNKWAEIAKCVPGRSENSIKNHWNATKRKQTSKRKIKRPERLRGIIQSTVLEEYIKKKYFNKGPTSTNSNTNNNPQSTTKINQLVQNNSPIAMNLSPSTPDDDEDDSTSYFTFETFDEEMNFMKNLFGNNDNSNQIINASQDSNISSSNFSISPQTTDVHLPMENVGNDLLASSSEPNMEQIGGYTDIPMQEAQDAYFSPDIYFYSYVFEGSFGNMGSNME
ncbi:hypothetical protein Pfo_021928 [Paulownia fortunei]|nr:hypothetical protein Pfo_021928 [Paulownia fortunei]